MEVFMQTKDKKISSMLSIVTGSIANSDLWEEHKVDTIVNAANPTLMGSNQGVDYAIHNLFDSYFQTYYEREKELGHIPLFEKTLNENICKELNTPQTPNFIRCPRGKAVVTTGYGKCSNIIHVVGAKYDGNPTNSSSTKTSDYCTSSCLNTLESCYTNIIEEVKKHSDIKGIGIPIIGSGAYNVPFELATKIAIASIGNALLDWKNQDKEAFEYAGIDHIVFFIYSKNKKEQTKKFNLSQQILNKYNEHFSQNQKVVFQSSKEAHYRYLREIKLNDTKRGYFSIAQNIRFGLMTIRGLFLPILCIKDIFGKENWHKRREIVEWIVLIKTLLPLLFAFLLQWDCFLNLSPYITVPGQLKYWMSGLILYCLSDTITYLLLLIIMSDIQRPSANVIRSIIMLFINYIEVECDIAFLYSICHQTNFGESLKFSFLGIDSTKPATPYLDFIFHFGNAGTKFFFTTLVFGYFFSHIRQRKFRS